MERLLLVDDEEWNLDGLKLILPWNDMGIELTECAVNGQEAIDIIEKEHPDIVLTDIRMPGLDGLDVAKYVFENKIMTEVIILSGYSDFEYARQAVGYNVASYLTKPVDSDELLITIENIRKKIQSKKEQTRIIKQFKTIEQNRKLSRMYLSDHQEHLSDGENCYITCVLQISKIQAREFEAKDGNYLLHLFKEGEWCGKDGVCFCNSTNANQYIFIANFKKSRTYEQQYCLIREEFERVLRVIRKKVYVEGCIGISEPYNNTSQSFKAYLEASFITENTVGNRNFNIITSEEFENNYQKVNILHQDIQDLMEMIEFGNREKTEIVLKRMRESLFSQNMIAIRLNIQEMMIGLSNLMVKHGGNMYELKREYADVFRKIWHIDSKEPLIELGEVLAEAVLDYIQIQKNEGRESLIQQIKRYVDEHYFESLILNEVAKEYFINATFFSRKFKQEIGVNFNTYVRKVRLNKAAEFLTNTDMKVYEIAQKVGFDNEDYFMKKFKEQYGVTPSVYREKNIQ